MPSDDLIGPLYQGNAPRPPTFGGGWEGVLMDYKARLYDSNTGRFIQPDTLIPNPADPQAWNRYSYVQNRPMVLTDPTGHRAACGALGEDCDSDVAPLHDELENFDAPERVREDEMIPYWDTRIAPAEHRLLAGLGGPFTAFRIQNINITASNAAVRMVPGAGSDGLLLNDPGDAFRHAYGAALMVRGFGIEFAGDFTAAHETRYSGGPDAREQAFMDFHNNAVGMEIAADSPGLSNADLEEVIFKALVSGDLYVWDGSDIYYSDSCPQCIY